MHQQDGTNAAFKESSSSLNQRAGMKDPAKSLTVQESLHTRSFWFLWITWTLAGAAGVSMTVLSTGYGLSKGFPLESAIIILTAFNLTNGIGRLISGVLSDRFGRNQIMSLTFLVAGLAYFALPTGRKPGSLHLSGSCSGLCLWNPFFGLSPAGGGLLRPPALRSYIRPNLCSLWFYCWSDRTDALWLPAGCNG